MATAPRCETIYASGGTSHVANSSWLLAAVLVMSFGLGVLAQPLVREADTIGQYGGEIRIATLGDPRTFNPYLAKETSSTDVIIGHIFEGLLGRNGVTTEH